MLCASGWHNRLSYLITASSDLSSNVERDGFNKRWIAVVFDDTDLVSTFFSLLVVCV
jgi:hypothetical protein